MPLTSSLGAGWIQWQMCVCASVPVCLCVSVCTLCDYVSVYLLCVLTSGLCKSLHAPVCLDVSLCAHPLCVCVCAELFCTSGRRMYFLYVRTAQCIGHWPHMPRKRRMPMTILIDNASPREGGSHKRSSDFWSRRGPCTLGFPSLCPLALVKGEGKTKAQVGESRVGPVNRVHVLALPFSCWLTLDRLSFLSGPQFPHGK